MVPLRAPGKQWTAAEDTVLSEQVAVYGENTENWKTIALALPGRTNKACRKRWKHSLHPSIKKTSWSEDEDALLLDLHSKYPGRWAFIATFIQGRTDDACSKRYREALDPTLKKDDWTDEEDRSLLASYHRHGPQWGKVGEELGRSGLRCRNRWRLLERRAKALERGKAKRGQADDHSDGSSSKRRKREIPDSEGDETEDQEKPRQTTQSGRLGRFSGEERSVDAQDRTTPALEILSQSGDSPSIHTPLPPIHPEVHPAANTIDPSVIGIALGKCSCGCLSGNSPCACGSFIPAGHPDILDSIDWAQLFPYLQAELPDIFVEMPQPSLNNEGKDGQGTVRPNVSFESIASAFAPFVGCGCGCGPKEPAHERVTSHSGAHCNRGCCSPTTGSAGTQYMKSVVMSSPAGCCSSKNSLAVPSTSSNANAEAAKLVLDYVAFLSQHQHGPPLPPQPLLQSSAGLSRPSIAAPSQSASSCQPPASQILINIIDKYQQQRSATNSMTSSLTPSPTTNLSRLPLAANSWNRTNTESTREDGPTADATRLQTTGGCCSSRMDDRQASLPRIADVLMGSPSHAHAAINETSYHPFLSLPLQPTAHPHDNSTPAPTQGRSCCGPRQAASSTGTTLDQVHSRSPYTAPVGSAFQLAPPTIVDDSSELPSYIPGCGCGCSENASPGSCTCGCVGICRCNAAASSSTGNCMASEMPFVQYDAVHPGMANSQPPNSLQTSYDGFGHIQRPQERPSALPSFSEDLSRSWTLPDVIPGCGCGCSDGATEGSCACGCVGICRCGLGAKLSVEYGTWDMDVILPLLQAPTHAAIRSEGGTAHSLDPLPPNPLYPSASAADRSSGSQAGGCCHKRNNSTDTFHSTHSPIGSTAYEPPLSLLDGLSSFSLNAEPSMPDIHPLPTSPSFPSERLPPINQLSIMSFPGSGQSVIPSDMHMMNIHLPFEASKPSQLHSDGAFSSSFSTPSPSLLPVNTHPRGSHRHSSSYSPQSPTWASKRPRNDSSLPSPVADGGDVLSRLATPDGPSHILLNSDTQQPQTRLSGQLAAPLPAYGCGHPDCWSREARSGADIDMDEGRDKLDPQGKALFHTSAELVDHRRVAHGTEDDAEPPGRGTGPANAWLYRCALNGCGKGWKSVNGIQYHLQLSKAHFQAAINERASAKQGKTRRSSTSAISQGVPGGGSSCCQDREVTNSQPLHTSRQTTSLSDTTPHDKRSQQHRCPHEGCNNVYKQISGLKYHLVHGHSGSRPLQLDHVPPALARKVDYDHNESMELDPQV